MMMWRSARNRPTRRLGKRPRRARRIVGWTAVLLGILTLIAAAAPALRLFGTEPYVIYEAQSPRIPVAAVMLSGDIGFRGGMSAYVAKGLAERGVTVVGVSSPVVFAHRRSQEEAVSIVNEAIREAMSVTGAKSVVLVGQSYGADIVATVLPHLAPDLMAHVRAVTLSVPGRNVFFRADPLGLEYLGTPDAHPADGLKAFRGPPVICTYGDLETDSLCPLLEGSANLFPLPGNHYLHHDHALLVSTEMAALHALIPAIRP